MLAASAEGLIELFRSEVDDRVIDADGGDAVQLWKDWELYVYLTEACDALAKDTSALFKLLALPFVAGQAVLPLPAYVLHIRHARLVARNQPIDLRNVNAQQCGVVDDYGLRLLGSEAMFESTGTPRAIVRDFERKALRLVPIPDAPDTLELQCSATVSVPLTPGAPLPFLDAAEQRLLLHYMKARAYEKQDAETEDLVRATRFQNQFDHGATERESKLRNYRRAPGTIRMAY